MTTLQFRPHTADAGTPLRTSDAAVTEEIPVLEMVEPLLGFPEQRRFTLIRLDDTGVICELRSLDDPDLRFVVVPPSSFFTGYAPEIDDATAQALDATSTEDLVTLVMVNTGESVESATANLLAPVLVNHRTRQAAQVVLHDDRLPVRAPLVPSSAAS